MGCIIYVSDYFFGSESRGCDYIEEHHKIVIARNWKGGEF